MASGGRPAAADGDGRVGEDARSCSLLPLGLVWPRASEADEDEPSDDEDEPAASRPSLRLVGSRRKGSQPRHPLPLLPLLGACDSMGGAWRVEDVEVIDGNDDVDDEDDDKGPRRGAASPESRRMKASRVSGCRNTESDTTSGAATDQR